MGKKKSKISKKKQAKAASRGAKAKTTAFGVSVVKGSKGRGRQDNNNNNTTVPGSSNNNNSNARGKEKKGGVAGFGSKKFTTSEHQIRKLQQQDGGARGASSSDERRDFDREYESLQERADARQQQQRKRGAGKKRNNKSQQKQQQQQTSALFQNLADSSLKLGPATVGEMVDETADKVAAGMSDIGRKVAAATSPFAKMPSAPPNTPSITQALHTVAAGIFNAEQQQQHAQQNTNLLQVLAAKKRQEWAAQKYMVQSETAKGGDNTNASMGDNRYAFLDNGDSDDDKGWEATGGDDNKQKLSAPKFQFAPPSFATGVSSFGERAGDGNPSSAGNDSDYDPDL